MYLYTFTPETRFRNRKQDSKFKRPPPSKLTKEVPPKSTTLPVESTTTLPDESTKEPSPSSGSGGGQKLSTPSKKGLPPSKIQRATVIKRHSRGVGRRSVTLPDADLTLRPQGVDVSLHHRVASNLSAVTSASTSKNVSQSSIVSAPSRSSQNSEKRRSPS